MKVSAHYEPGRKTVAILTTGGTIAGSGEIGKETGYVPGALSAEELIASVPQLSESVNIRAVEICSVNSDDITGEIWIHMARTINELAQDDEIAGFVVTHGTDTLEESAYFLDLTVKTDKPVVLTGAMRPATSLSADGAMSLYQAVCAAADKKSVGLGVLCVFSDQIFSARAVGKSSTYQVTAISGGETGCLGVVRNDEVFYYQAPLRRRVPYGYHFAAFHSRARIAREQIVAFLFKRVLGCGRVQQRLQPLHAHLVIVARDYLLDVRAPAGEPAVVRAVDVHHAHCEVPRRHVHYIAYIKVIGIFHLGVDRCDVARLLERAHYQRPVTSGVD